MIPHLFLERKEESKEISYWWLLETRGSCAFLRHLALFSFEPVCVCVLLACPFNTTPTTLSLSSAMRRLPSWSVHGFITALLLATTASPALAQEEGFDPNVDHYNGSSYQLVNGIGNFYTSKAKGTHFNIFFFCRCRRVQWFYGRISQLV